MFSPIVAIASLMRVGDRLAGSRIGGGGNRFDRTVGGQGNRGNAADEVLEGIVAGNEVGLGVDFDDDSLVAGAGNADQAFGSGAAGLLVGLGDALGAQPVDRGFDVAVGLGQRLLAVHHACAGLFAQFLYQCCCDVAIVVPLVGSSVRRPSAEVRLRPDWGRNVPGNVTA